MPTLTYREALNQAINEEMRRDPSVFIIGEEVGLYHGAYKVTKGLVDDFGEMRVRDAPIAEEMIVGVGIGAALAGLRPIAEMMTFNFSLLAIDQIVNHAAKIRYMSGGQLAVPLVIRGPGGAGNQLAAQHSQALEAWFCHVPGLVVVTPATPRDAKGLLKSAIRSDDPVVFIEGELLYGAKGEVPDEEYTTPLGVGAVVREGSDVTVVAYSRMLHMALEAAAELERLGISAEVVDPRTLRPLDEARILQSVAKTNRCVVVAEAWPVASMATEIAHRVARGAFDVLDAPVEVVAGVDVPTPYARRLADATQPDVPRIIAAVKRVLYLD